MEILKYYKQGFTESIRSFRLLFILYAANFLLALSLALPFFDALETGFGNSMSQELLNKKLNFTVLTDFLNNNGNTLNVLINQLKWVAVFYYLLILFFTGGILRTINRNMFSVSSFFSACGANFWRFTLSGLFFIVLQIFIAALVYIPAVLLFQSADPGVVTESLVFRYIYVSVAIHAILAIPFLIIADYAKYYLFLHNSYNVFKAFANSFKYVFRNFLKTFGLFLLLTIPPALILYFYTKAHTDISMQTGFGILVMFLIQQIFIFLRIWTRVWVHASQFDMFTVFYLNQQKKQEPVLESGKIYNAENASILTEEEILKREEII